MKCKICSVCKKEKGINEFYKDRTKKTGYAYMCKDCHAPYSRAFNSDRIKWNKEHKESLKLSLSKWFNKNKNKAIAYQSLNKEINKGRIERKPCEVCGAIKSHAHHPDYSKPLEVIWLCPLHHKEIHGYRVKNSLISNEN